MVRAKFRCDSINDNESGDGKSISLSAVTGGSKENDSFFVATPAGQLHLSTVNEQAAAQFEQGKEYYLDISPAE